jgi:hypothetical protein
MSAISTAELLSLPASMCDVCRRPERPQLFKKSSSSGTSLLIASSVEDGRWLAEVKG